MSDLSMLRNILGEDQDVIQVYHNHTFRDHILEDLVHHGLEGGRTIGETKEHDKRFKETSVSAKGSLPLISFFDADIVETPMNVKLGEVARTTKLVDKVRDERERVLVLHSHIVEHAIVLDQTKGAILFLHKEDW